MSETVYADDSMPPIVGSGSNFLELEGPEIHETCSATTDGVLIFPPIGDPWLISGLDIEFNQNHGDADNLTDDDEDLPSLRDILQWNWKRNPEVIDLAAEDDAVCALNNRTIQISV
jgi:hypothetical protein